MSVITLPDVKLNSSSEPTYDVLASGRPYIEDPKMGRVELVDMMPRIVPEGRSADFAIVQAARTSNGAGLKSKNEDANLVRYLYRHKHTTPYEQVVMKFFMVMPVFVARQFIRHRTACLAGNVELHFDLPGGLERRGSQLYKLTVQQVYERFQPTTNSTQTNSQKNSLFKRERIQGMKLRCLNEGTGQVTHTSIVDIWSTGVKPTYRVTLADGSSAVMSKDHRCLTDKGWLKLEQIVSLPDQEELDSDLRIGDLIASEKKARICSISTTAVDLQQEFNEIDEQTESWLPVVGWEDYYAVSDQGRVRRIVGGQGSCKVGRCKTITVSDGRAVVSLNKPGVQVTRLVHQLVLEAFVGPRPPNMEACHYNDNSLDNRLENLRWDTTANNAKDRVRNGTGTRLTGEPCEITCVEYVGEQETFDIEVSGPWHNFSAGGLVVHNSVNEYSARYAEVADDFFLPEAATVRSQSTTNKQGGSAALSEADAQEFMEDINEHNAGSYRLYKKWLDKGVARELARVCLPVSMKTQWYWTANLHNIYHLLALRMDSHAQLEIRWIASAMYELVRRVLPCATLAFDDYHPMRNAMTLTALELRVAPLSIVMADKVVIQADPQMGRREVQEWIDKAAELYGRSNVECLTQSNDH